MPEEPANVCPCCGAPIKTDIVVSLDFNHVTRGGKSVPLSPTQAEILEVMRHRYPGPVTVDYLLDTIYGRHGFAAEKLVNANNTMKVQMSNLRKKIAPLGLKIASVYGVGWRLVKEEA